MASGDDDSADAFGLGGALAIAHGRDMIINPNHGDNSEPLEDYAGHDIFSS